MKDSIRDGSLAFEGSKATLAFADGGKVLMTSGIGDLAVLFEAETARAEARQTDWAELIPRQLKEATDKGGSFDATHLLKGLTGSAMTFGSRHRDTFRPLAAAVAEHIRTLDLNDPQIYSIWLSDMALMNLLQIMGLEFDPEVEKLAADGLPYLATTRVEPPSYDWSKGVAALALDRPIVYRNVSALPESGASGFDPSVMPEYNAQGWLAQFAAAVEHGASDEQGNTLWRQFLQFYVPLLDIRSIRNFDLAWVARVVQHRIKGQPVETVADWMAVDLRSALDLD